MSMNYEGTPGEYIYTEDENGKTASGVVKVGAQSERNRSAQRNAGGEDRQPGDQGGHLIAHSLGGRNDPTNLDAQAANANQIDQAAVERNVSKLAFDSNNTVALQVSNFNSVGDRPDATMINVGVKDKETGKISEQHISFQNASHELQESWNNTANIADQEIDPAQDAGMTAEQRALANELSGAEDFVDEKLGKDDVYMEFDNSFLDGGEVETDPAGTNASEDNESEVTQDDGDVSDSEPSDGMSDADGLSE